MRGIPPTLGCAVVHDGMGELRVDVSSIHQRFLEAFRLRGEHAASVDETAREEDLLIILRRSLFA